MHNTPPPADEPNPAEPAPVTETPLAAEATEVTDTPGAQAPAEADAPTEVPATAAAEAVVETLPKASGEVTTESATEADADTDTETDAEGAGETATESAADKPAPTADAPAAPPAAPPVPDLPAGACAALLAEHFPALFGKGVFLPIKLRIQADIQTRVPGVFNRKSLSIFLHRHTTATGYIKALVKATQRFDLDGQPEGEITDEHREAGVAELARRREIVDGRRAQERESLRAKQQDDRNAARKVQQAREAAQHTAEHEARRERAALLRAFESSTLTRANFCALKGIPEEGLDARLDQAWHEREARAHEAPPHSSPTPPAARKRPDDRGERSRPRGPRPASKSAGKAAVKPDH